jgi:hypothetical protein
MNTVKLITVIETTLLRRGEGRGPDDCMRIITQYWTLTGELIIESDPCAILLSPESLPKIREFLFKKLGENFKTSSLWNELLDLIKKPL